MISVIIPAYNVEEYIGKCLDSLLNQSYRKLEIIVVNDGSTDSTRNIIEKYRNENNNIICIDTLNQGVSVARNIALQQSSGEYVIFIDPDDFLEEQMLEKMVNKMKITHSDVIICGYIKYFNEDNFENNLFKVDTTKIYSSKQILDLLLLQEVKGFLWNKLFRRDDLIKNNFEFEEGRYIQDYFPVFKQLVDSERVSFVNEPLYYYRQRESSITGKKNEKILIDYFYAVNKILKYINETQLNPDEKLLNIFMAQVQCEIIHRFWDCNSKLGKKIYTKFNDEGYENYTIDIKGFLNKDINMKIKIKLLLWKFNIFHLIKK